MATATSTLGFSRNIATSLAIVIGSVVFNAGMDDQTAALNSLGLPAEVAQAVSGHSAAANVMVIETIADPDQKLAVQSAFSASLKNVWIMCTCMCACSMIASVFIRRKVLSTVHVEVKTGLAS